MPHSPTSWARSPIRNRSRNRYIRARDYVDPYIVNPYLGYTIPVPWDYTYYIPTPTNNNWDNNWNGWNNYRYNWDTTYYRSW